MTTNPPTLPSRASIHHNAATYSIIAILAAIGLNIALTPALKELDPSSRRWASLFVGVILLSALPAGILALCGIRKHGKNGLLWKGLVGSVVPLLLVAMAVPAFLKVRSNSIEKQVSLLVSDVNQRTPLKVDDITRLDRAFVTGEREITVQFTITAHKSSEIDMGVWNTEVVPKLRSTIIGSPFGALLIRGVVVKYVYSGSDGSKFTDLTFKPEEYKN